MVDNKYGFNLSEITAPKNANYIEYRTLLLLFGFILGVLFANFALMGWGVLFFLLGVAAEVTGKVSLKIGLVFSFNLVLISLFEYLAGDAFWYSTAIFALISIGLGIESINRKPLSAS